MKPIFNSSKLMLLCISLWLIVCSSIRYLSVPDEGRYGDISRAMLQSGDWLVPRINGLPFLHKPPLLHWISSALMEVFGVHVWVLRLVPALAGILMLIGLFWFLKKYYNEQIAQLSVIILSTNFLFFGSSQYVNHDLLVACWISLTVFFFADYTLSGKKNILFLGYIVCALGFLTKGLIAVLIPGMVILPWVLMTGQWKKIPSLLHPLGLLIFIVIAMPWIYLVQQKYPVFLHYFFIDQQFNRFSSDDFNNKQPWSFYLVCLFISSLPWLFAAKFKFSSQLFKQQLGKPVFILILWWFISVTAFFSIPPSKLVGYILPAIAPFTILIAIMLDSVLAQHKISRVQVWAPTVFVLIFSIFFAVLPFIGHEKLALTHDDIQHLYLLAGTLFILMNLLVLAYKKKKLSYVKFIFSTLVLLCISIGFGAKILDQKNNANQVSFKKNITTNATIVFYHNYFYDVPLLLNLQQPVYLVDDWDVVGQDSSSMQLKDGLLFEPERKKYLWSENALQHQIVSGQPTVLLARANTYKNKYANVQVLHYRNYDVYFFNYEHSINK